MSFVKNQRNARIERLFLELIQAADSVPAGDPTIQPLKQLVGKLSCALCYKTDKLPRLFAEQLHEKLCNIEGCRWFHEVRLDKSRKDKNSIRYVPDWNGEEHKYYSELTSGFSLLARRALEDGGSNEDTSS